MRTSALNGANSATLVETAGGGPFAADATAIYFADKWTIKRVSIAGGVPQRVATGDFYIRDVATDGANVYWVEDGPFSVVRSVPVNGGTSPHWGPDPGRRGASTSTPHTCTGLRTRTKSIACRRLAASRSGSSGRSAASPPICHRRDERLHLGLGLRDHRKAPLAGGAISTLASTGADQTRRIETDGGRCTGSIRGTSLR